MTNMNSSDDKSEDKSRTFGRDVRIAIALVAVLSFLAVNGCSVFMAAKQPGEKNLEVLTAGTPRTLVLAELGQPVATELRNGKRCDVFSFVQGYSKGARVGRAFFHGVADVFTLGLWEVVGTPTEAIFDGTKTACEVTYDERDKVEKVVVLQGDQVRPVTEQPPTEGKGP
jgi:hypothetical protein